jgi:uncharacterized protein YkwD
MPKKKPKDIDFLRYLQDANRDSDKDGLTDWEELVLGTDPFSSDSDKDGLSDYAETKLYGTDPLDADTDKDGMSDGQEVALGRNPNGPGMLKDFFIPHSGNGFLPQALHPHRVAFHAAAAIAIKTAIIFLVASYPLEAWLTPDLALEERGRLISVTNELREEKGIDTLAENSRLNEAAYAKLQDMLAEQYFDHVSPSKNGLNKWLSAAGYNYGVAGENLAMGYTRADEIVKAWQKSPSHNANLLDADYSEIGAAFAAGQYLGRDTAFAVQLFGDPYRPLRSAAFLPTISEPAVPAKPVTLPTEVKPTVKPAKTKAQLQAPTEILPLVVAEPTTPSIALEAPYNGLVVNVGDVRFTGTATGTDKLLVYSNGELAGELTVDDQDRFDAVLTLADGDHDVQIRPSDDSLVGAVNGLLLSIDKQGPVLDSDKSALALSENQPGDRQLVAASVFLSADTDKADLVLAGRTIALSPDPAQANRWTGSGFIDRQTSGDVTVLASVVARDRAGTTAISDLAVTGLEPASLNSFERYLFYRDHRPLALQAIFDIGSIYYKIMLGLSLLALALNVAIEHRRQHPRAVLSTAGLASIIIILIFI